jgi:kinetochore protein Nuf2
MRFSQQRATFVQSVRDKSKSIFEERDQVEHELAEVTQHIEAVKSKQAANEPKCEEYRKENTALTAKMIATKEIQEKTAGECEALKQDKSDLLRRKASISIFFLLKLNLP